jgi:hypothetical protein
MSQTGDIGDSTPRTVRKPMLTLCLLAGIVVATTLAIPPAFRTWGDNGYMVLALATGFAAAVATVVAQSAPARQSLWLIFAVAVLLRGILLFTEPLLSTDIYRYIWDGRMQAAGINPYRYVPADAALNALRDATIFPNINRADYAVTIYPPVAQMFFLAVTRVSESVTMMKLALLACEAVTVVFLFRLLRDLGRPVTRLVGYLWHPLPLWEIANSGHIDALMIALLMMGLWLGLSGKPLRGAVSITLGALAKPFSAIALPVIWRPWDWKLPAAALATALVCYIPFLSVGWGVFGFLAQGYANEEGISSGDRLWPLAVWRWVVGTMSEDVIIYFIAATLAIAGLALHTAFRSPPWSPAKRIAALNNLLLAALFVVSPNYPWYFLIATPFVALVGGAPVWAITVGAVLLQEEAGWGEFIPELIRKSALYAAFLAACAYWLWQSRLRGSPQRRVEGDALDHC